MHHAGSSGRLVDLLGHGQRGSRSLGVGGADRIRLCVEVVGSSETRGDLKLRPAAGCPRKTREVSWTLRAVRDNVRCSRGLPERSVLRGSCYGRLVSATASITAWAVCAV